VIIVCLELQFKLLVELKVYCRFVTTQGRKWDRQVMVTSPQSVVLSKSKKKYCYSTLQDLNILLTGWRVRNYLSRLKI